MKYTDLTIRQGCENYTMTSGCHGRQLDKTAEQQLGRTFVEELRFCPCWHCESVSLTKRVSVAAV